MKLFIAEKPSQAKAVAVALGVGMTGNVGYYQNNLYTITWCFGHMYERRKIVETWTINNTLKISNPTNSFIEEYEPKNDVKQQLKIIKTLLKSEIEEIVCCTDPDAEGESIFREVIEANGTKCNNISRMWIKDLTANGVNTAFNSRKNINEYEGLRQRAYLRSYFDYSYGLSLTQLTTLIANDNKVYNVGRVQTPTLKMIYDRYMENKNHVTNKKQTVDVEIPILNSKIELNKEFNDYFDNTSATTYIDTLNKSNFIVECTEEKMRKIKPNKFHSLSTLQKFAAKKLNIQPKETLSYLQSLYESKLVSYPRTDCNQITKNTADTLSQMFGLVVQHGVGQVSAHEGLIPTSKYAGDQLTGTPKKLYDEIYYTSLANCYEAIFVKDKEIIVKDNANKLIWSKKFTQNLMNPGAFKKELDYFKDFKISSEINKEQMEKIDTLTINDLVFIKRDYETKPKPLLTSSTLISKMENIHLEFEDQELKTMSKETKGIGTEATRGDIIDNLFKRKFIVNKGKSIVPTEAGVELIEKLINLSNPLLNLEYSANLEKGLKLVEENKSGIEFMKTVNNELEKIVEGNRHLVIVADEERFAECPICTNDLMIKKGKFGIYYNCSCGLNIPGNVNITKEDIDLLANDSETSVKTLKSKTGKDYSCSFKLNKEKKELERVFAEKTLNTKVVNEICKCRCAGKIVERDGQYGKYYQCDKSGFINTCSVRIPGYYNLTNKEIQDLVFNQKKLKVEQVSKKTKKKYFINIWMTDDNDDINKEFVN